MRGSFLSCLLVITLIFPASGQDPLQFKHITTADGLSQSSVISIIQDEEGVMWFGTRDGLNKYDGESFTIYRGDPDNPQSLSNNDILDITMDSDGDLWIATYNGLNHYDAKRMTFRRYLNDPKDENSISNNTVTTVIEVSPGVIWAGTRNGLSIINKTKNTVKRIFHQSSSSTSVSANHISSIHKDKRGNVWIGTVAGLNKYVDRPAKQDIVFERIPIENSEAIEDIWIQDISDDANGNIWIGTRKTGLFILDSEGMSLRPYVNKKNNAVISSTEDIRSIALDDNGFMWLGTYDGVIRISPDGQANVIKSNALRENSLSKNTVKSIYKDRSGSIWIGTYYGGVNFWNEANNNFSHILALANGDGLSYNVVSSIAENSNNLFFGTEGGGVTIKKKNSGKYSYLHTKNSNIPSDNIKSIHLASDGRSLWVGTFNDGIAINTVGTKRFAKVISKKEGLSHNSIYSIQELNSQEVLIGTFGGGINIYNTSTGEVRIFQHDQQDRSSLCDDQVRTTIRDKKGNLWIGTQNGLSFLSNASLSKRDFKFKHYFNNWESKSGQDVLTIFEDSKGAIWVGTKETGLHILKEGRFEEIALYERYENKSSTIHSMAEDASGLLWISSNDGIIKYDPVKKTKELYKIADGLISNEFNNNAVLKSSSGIMYFGSPFGVNYFNPIAIQRKNDSTSVLLTSLKVRNTSILPGDETKILEKSITRTSAITLNYDQAIFTLGFVQPNYISTGKTSYAYRLIGLDDKWKYTTASEASFTIQKAGSYTFEVKKAGAESAVVSSIDINVKPAPWRTWWAFALYAVAIAFALFSLQRIVKSRAELQHDLEYRQRENEQQSQLNKMKLQFFTNISHEFRTPLTLILGPLQQIIDEYRGSSKLFKQLIVIQQNANQLLKLINQLMEFRKLESNQANLEAAEGDIVKFIKEVFLSFKLYAQSEGFQYEFSSSNEPILAFFDRDKMERVMYNLISNAFKYTNKKGSISVNVGSENEKVIIQVTDNGIGMNEEQIKMIFNRFYQVNQDSQHSQEFSKGTGIGLALTKSIVDLHRGKIEVESKEGEGTTFSVTLPLGADHLQKEEIIQDFKNSEDVSLYHMTNKVELVFDTDESENTEDNYVKKKILVVEDNPQVRQFIISLLDPGLYEVSEASDGKEGLTMVRKNEPDLVISDVMMPVMDGIALCSEIKSNLKTSHIPVILLTARTSLIFKFEGLESGADEYINKPFDVKELQLKVKNLLKVIDQLKAKFNENPSITPSEVTISSIDEDLFKRAIQIMNDNISNQFLDIPLFCSELGVSRTMLFTKIKAWTNMTPNEFIQSMRMKRAAQLLEQGKINVSQVSFNVGYKNPKYFSKSFQKYHALTPTEYAKKFKV